MPKIRTNITIDTEVKKTGQETAQKQGISFSCLLEQLLRNHLETTEKTTL